ncbi:uncharacterized protein LOC131318149 [Rhododendron vialii]|uniref:uncharacterized protein LOC131318149 n=1 Tax=Rhododendron vialii TaxID=182163 RepID=UPI00265F2F27|nr:uncharacterized protein LOC131318149 [Rhododendron vialii]
MPSEAELTWTTWEELLLACAVKRHGTKDWGSVAMELQARSSLSLLFTSQVCKNKYDDLRRRFTEKETDDVVDTIPWLEELRKLRVSELKQEVHRYDLSIQSLQLKVKSLEEERERSLKENENDDGEPDLGKNLEERSANEKNDDARAPELAVGDVSDRENRSFNESCSTANRPAGLEGRAEPEPVGTSGFKPDPVSSDSKPASEDSYNDSSSTVAAKQAAAAKVSREKKGGELAGLRDSVEGSKDGVKESSDVQSSASLTRKRRREKEVSGGGKPVVSPATIKREGVKSEPLVGLLDIIRSHKHGSMFERRLEYQIHRDEYKNMVRTHMDLETIRTRLENGSYSYCTTKFYRDLLLLFTNAIVFFPRASIESVTAHELRDLVLEEVKKQKSTQRSHSSSPDPAPSNPTSLETKPDPRKPESLLAKDKSSGPILVCRKRSSISAKTSQPTDGKPNLNPNAPAKNSSNLKGEESRKTNERPATGTRSTRSNKGSQTITSPPDSKTNSLAGKAGNVMRNDKKKKKKNEVAAAAVKKQGAADFLRRIKRNSPLKSGGGEGNSGGGRRENMKRGDGKKETPLVKPGGSRKRRKEESSPLKQRGAGRPSRKGPAEGGGRKRGREGGGAEAGSKQTRKRSRR